MHEKGAGRAVVQWGAKNVSAVRRGTRGRRDSSEPTVLWLGRAKRVEEMRKDSHSPCVGDGRLQPGVLRSLCIIGPRGSVDACCVTSDRSA